MPNWYGTSRSNYFAVKDKEAFLAWAKLRNLNLLSGKENPTVFGIYPHDELDGDWPSYDLDSDEPFDLCAELARHLAKGQVAILVKAGAEKLRYVTGEAIAVNHRGRCVTVYLNDIYAKAARAFRVPVDRIGVAKY